MVNWTELPDLAAVGLLAGAFASVARRNLTHISKTWLIGWLMVAAHFGVLLFQDAPGIWGVFSVVFGMAALVWAGLLFMWASVPYRKERSSRWILAALLVANTLYISLLVVSPYTGWSLDLSAGLLGIAPLAIALSSGERLQSPLRWTLIALYCSLSVFLLIIHHLPGNGPDLALEAVLCTVYLGCCIHFWYAYRRATAGAFITIAGFLAWSAVFVVGPLMQIYRPLVHVDPEVWNLPKYLVALGMILLLLEDQIEHNKYLALHDELTKLPNRRLFQDRLANALERARRTGSQTVLLLIDLDRFKQVNDTLGHHVGDQVLQRVAGILTDRTRCSDTVARTGGDEFSIILNEAASREDADRVSRSVMRLLEQPFELNGETVKIGASVGIAVFPEDASAMESLCVMADVRMYADKQTARNRRRVESMQPALPLPFPAVKAQT